MIDPNENNTEAFLRILVEPMQEVQDAIQQLRLMRWISSATGYQQDVIGRIVGQPRLGLDNDTYRRVLRAKVRVNRSSGLVEDLIAVSDLVVFDDAATYVVVNHHRAAVTVRVDGIVIGFALAALLFSLLRNAVAAGVGLVLEFALSSPSGLFRFRRDDGTFTAHTGFRRFDGTIAGRLGAAIS